MRLFELLNEVGDHNHVWANSDPRLSDNLTNIMTNAAERVGVTLGISSGFRELDQDTGKDSAGSKSGRHTHGNASDTKLYLNGEQLSVNNPAHVPYIQAFTKEFLNNARSQGYSPSVGIGTEYMGGDTFHYDIASGLNRRPDGSKIIRTYWGNNSSGDGAVSWLPELYNNTNEFEIPDFTPGTIPDRRVADASSSTRVSTRNPPSQRTIEPRFDPSSLANVGTKNYNIRRGSSGENVSQLQTQLQNLGYDIGTTGADGKFGKNTAAAVRQFQKDYNLQVDGIVGDQTMSALSQLKKLPVNTPSPQVGGTGATSMGNIGDGTRGTNLDARDAANMAAANKPRNISYGDTMGVTTKPSKPALVTTKLPPVPPRTNII